MISLLNKYQSLVTIPLNPKSGNKVPAQPEFEGKIENKNSDLWDQCLTESENSFLNTLGSAKKHGKITKNITSQTDPIRETEVIVDTQDGQILINENINQSKNTVRLKVTKTTRLNPATEHSDQIENIWEVRQKEIKRIPITCEFTTYKP